MRVQNDEPLAELTPGLSEDVSEDTSLNEASAGSFPNAPPAERNATAVWMLATIATVSALYLARAFIVPLLFGILVSYTLKPIVNWFERCRIPRAIGAGLILAILVGGTSWMALSFGSDAAEMAETLPQAAKKIRQSLSGLGMSREGVLHNMQEAVDELKGATVDAGLNSKETPTSVSSDSESGAWLRDFMLTQSALVIIFTAQAPVVLLLTYFLLASGTHFRRKLVQFVGPSLSQKKNAVRVLEQVDDQIQGYLFVMLVSNALVGVLTWLAFQLIGLEHAGMWGAAAGILHFIPYLGTIGIALASGIIALLEFGSLSKALVVVAAFLLVSGIIGMLFTTWLQGKFARVNAAVLFIVLLFFGWLWGVAGLLLGAPLLAIAKVICDRVESLKPIGELLGR